MPKKTTPNSLNLRHISNKEIISFLTTSKKNHFDCSESKLFDELQFAFQVHYGYYVVHLSTYPCIGVHIHGAAFNLKGKEKEFNDKIESVLQSHLKVF